MNTHMIFHKGPFRNLNAHEVAEEIKGLHKQIVLLGSVFADTLGAKRVVETIRKRMEKFIGFLPLLHAICNPGFAARHWHLVIRQFLKFKPSLIFYSLPVMLSNNQFVYLFLNNIKGKS